MRTISWKHPLIALFIGGAVVVACSDDEPAKPAEEAGAKCGDGEVNGDEKCDPKATQRSCSSATMGMKTMGKVTCKDDCSAEDTTKCTAGGGAGGGGGMGGGTGGSVGGTGGGPNGGKPGMEAGVPEGGAGKDSGTTTPPDSGKPDSGGSGGAGGAGGTPVDSGRD
jgi:hypothetical protein